MSEFWKGVVVSASVGVLALTLTACYTTKTMTVPANADATCSVHVPPGVTTNH